MLIVAILLLSLMTFLSIGTDHKITSPTDVPDLSSFSYVISKEGSMVEARNVASGELVFSSYDCREVIQYALDAPSQGGKVLVKAGMYSLSGEVTMNNDTWLIGEGSGTVFDGKGLTSILIDGRSNVTIGGFTLNGDGNILVTSSSSTPSGIIIRDVTATIGPGSEGAFYILASGYPVRNVSFVRCNAIDCCTTGFMNNAMDNGSWVENITYSHCKATGCGLKERYNDWVVGFDLAELVNVRNMTLQDCTSFNNWQSGFHFEKDIQIENAVLQNCISNDNGQAKGYPDGEGYGWGFKLYRDEPLHDIHLYDCSAIDNWHGETNIGPLSQVQG